MPGVRHRSLVGIIAGPQQWYSATGYLPLENADRSVFAWEWLRRSSGYRRAWIRHEAGLGTRRGARRFGLERFEDPALPAPIARVLWTAELDPAVIQAKVADPFAGEGDRIDLRLIAHLVTLYVDDDGVEHILLSDGRHGLRIDLVEGTLIGSPSSLAYALQGLSQLRGPIATLNRLRRLIQCHGFEDSELHGRRDRWIMELRVADALACGASNQDIARVLFAEAIPARLWRSTASSYRQRVQRLARRARSRLSDPLDPHWFAPD